MSSPVPQVIAALVLLAYAGPGLTAPLPSYRVDPAQTSVSGISSGGYMAVQFAVAHSDQVMGVGVFAGGPYRCASNVTEALGRCTQGQPDTAASIAATRAAAGDGRIAPLDRLARQRVWLFSGYNDGVVQQPVMDSLYRYFNEFTPASAIYYQDSLPAGHAMITLDYGGRCAVTGGEFINDCDYDGAGLLLRHIYGELNPPTAQQSGEILSFDQAEFTSGSPAQISLAEQGFLYVPDDCAAGATCRVHVAFHGCRQYAQTLDDAFYRNAGYNEWADSNHLIILYPQTRASAASPFNPKGCWDWWGYNGANFADREGPQIRAVRAMLRRLGRDAGASPVAPATSIGNAPHLSAADSADDAVALVWPTTRPATAFHVERAGEDGAFVRLSDVPVEGGSFADAGLSPERLYRYRLVPANGGAADAASVDIRTRAPAPACEPYFSDNVTHVSRGRAFAWFGLTFARGSWDYLGFWSLLSESAVYRDGESFQRGVCP